MIKKFGFYLTILITISLSSCSTVKAMGVFYQENTENQDWIRFYKLPVQSDIKELNLISNVSLKGIYKNKIAINPVTETNRIYWVKTNNQLFRSYEDTMKNVSQEAYFRNFQFPTNTTQIFIDWKEKAKKGLKTIYFVYYISDNKIWKINNKTEQAELAYENIIIPIDATNINIIFEEREYPIIYKKNKKPVRINSRTGQEQIFLDITIEGDLYIDQNNNSIYEINSEKGIISYNKNGNGKIINTSIMDYYKKLVSPTIINGILFFGINETEEILIGKDYL